jgi:hypothetical protein
MAFRKKRRRLGADSWDEGVEVRPLRESLLGRVVCWRQQWRRKLSFHAERLHFVFTQFSGIRMAGEAVPKQKGAASQHCGIVNEKGFI